MLEIKNVSKVYKMGDNVVHALRDVSLTIERGDFVAIMGPSGSGKSTLMNLLGLLDVPSSGSYSINGRQVIGDDAGKMSEDDLARLRRQTIGFIFQQFNLLPRMTATENVALPQFYTQPGTDHEKAKLLLDRVGLGKRKSHRTNELSGGQQQRVAIARSLVNDPLLILADEPTGNLDSASEKEIMGMLRALNEQGITVIVVTHEDEIGAQAKRRIRMRDGVIQSDERLGGPPTVSEAPSASHQAAKAGSQLFTQARELSRQALKTLWSNKVRTALSVLGILIGVAAVIAMLAIGTGAQQEIEKQLSSLGSNLLVLRPGATRMSGVVQETGATRLTLEDASALRQNMPFIDASTPLVTGRGQVTFANKNWNTEVTGAEDSYMKIRAATPTRGRFFTNEEAQLRSRVALLGMTVVRELFGERSPIGEMIKINKVNFQVIGILPEKGSSGWRDQDNVIVIPIQTAMKRLFGKSYVDSIEIQVRANADMTDAEDSVVNFMVDRHRVPAAKVEDAFRVQNMADLQAALSSSSKTMSALLASIAAISLLVGGIGIMNIMLVSVTERTREIGLRKAIGARPIDILLQFLVESMVMSALGGLCGILLGWAITKGVSGALGWATVVSPTSVAVAFFFSATIGVIFGIYPARKASALNPIEALRYE